MNATGGRVRVFLLEARFPHADLLERLLMGYRGSSEDLTKIAACGQSEQPEQNWTDYVPDLRYQSLAVELWQGRRGDLAAYFYLGASIPCSHCGSQSVVSRSQHQKPTDLIQRMLLTRPIRCRKYSYRFFVWVWERRLGEAPAKRRTGRQRTVACRVK